ncbi:MAG: peptidoglycan-binding domain-containing protein [candidate division Zixibacteria bacterium]
MRNLIDTDHIAKELTFERTLSFGQSGPDVKMAQEWLNLHGIELVIDGKYGANTRRAIIRFQHARGIKESGLVDADTFNRLTLPIRRAIAMQSLNNDSPNHIIVSYAEQHLRECPHEIGGQNRGPWVRLFMKGNEGRQWSWCAGFVSFILMQTFATLSNELILDYTFSCDELAHDAMEKNIFIEESQLREMTIKPGMIFLKRRKKSDWVHAGIVTSSDGNYINSIEGNTNEMGRYNGDRVMRKRRVLRNINLINPELATAMS